jgi:hypothetical protein
MIILENRNANVMKLPNRAANIQCNYLYEDQMGRPEVPQAYCLLEPFPETQTRVNTTSYDPVLGSRLATIQASPARISGPLLVSWFEIVSATSL